MPINNKYQSLLVLLFILLGIAVYFGCKLPAEQETQEPTPEAKPVVPEKPVDKAFDAETFIYGFFKVDDQEPWITHLHEQIKKDMAWGLEKPKADLSIMVKIPAGEMEFGCSEAESNPVGCIKKQRRQVKEFFIDKSELTNAEYEKCVQEKMCLPVLPQPHIAGATKPDAPALLTFKQAERYCLFAGKRLPTEVEWEMAARGTDGRLYPWGNSEPTPKHGNICGKSCTFDWADSAWIDGYAHTASIGQFPEGNSQYGLLDMAGNVKEWVKADSPQPKDRFIARGASWYSTKREMFVYYRQQWVPQTRVDDKGVRCAADLPKSE